MGACVAIWMFYGFLQARRAASIRVQMARIDQKARFAMGPVIMVAGAVVLLFGIGFVALIHGLQNGSLTPPGWVIVTLVGLAFVHSQVLAAMMILSAATQSEPAGSGDASDGRINDRNSNEPKNPARS